MRKSGFPQHVHKQQHTIGQLDTDRTGQPVFLQWVVFGNRSIVNHVKFCSLTAIAAENFDGFPFGIY